MDDMVNIMVVGVGGQGILLTTDIMAEVALEKGFDVKKSEIHGIAQRGGVVTSHVSFGKEVYLPVIKKGNADIVLAFEEMEALRVFDFLGPKGKMIVNTQRIIPSIVSSGLAEYPSNIMPRLRATKKPIVEIDALKIAVDLGNTRLVSTILLGSLSSFLDFNEKDWEEKIKENVPKGTESVNIEGFREGRRVTQKTSEIPHV